MHEKPTIRKAAASDADIIAEIYNESIRAVDSTMIDIPIDGEEILQQMNGFSDREAYYVMEADDYVVGWGVIKRFKKGPAYAFTGETSVFLRRSETQKGYGTRLKKYLLDQCEALGYHHLVARIWASNAHSIAYNQRFGYDVVGIQKEVGHMNGQWRDVALLQLIFDSPLPAPKCLATNPQSPALSPQPSAPSPQPPALSPQPSALIPYSPRGGYRFTAEVSATNPSTLKALLTQASEQGYHHILAWISNDEVVMYLSAGFEVVGIQQEICIGQHGWEDITVMQLILPA